MKALFLVLLLTCALIALDSGVDSNAHDIYLLETMEDLRSEHPSVSDECVLVAAHILVGRFNEIDHMMQQKGVGRCATGVVGLRARVRYDDTIISY